MKPPNQLPAELAGHALVDDRRVHVAVAEYHIAAVQRRTDDFAHVLNAVRNVKQKLGVGVQAAVGGIQQNRPYLTAECRSAGLAGHRAGGPVGFERLHQPGQNRGLARTFDAFQGDEHGLQSVRPVSGPAAATGSGAVAGPRKKWRPRTRW